MAIKKRWNSRNIPFCADPENHVLVETKEGLFWRKKRTKNDLNEHFAENADLARIAGPAARQVAAVLRPFLGGIDTGRLTLRFINAFRKGLKEKKKIELSVLEGLEMQRDRALHQLLLAPYEVVLKGQLCKVRVPVDNDSVKKQNRLATHFYFEAVMVHGDAEKENGLRVERSESKLYGFGQELTDLCELSVPLPENGVQWMVLLKVSCLEGNEMAHHPMHYGMKVVKGGWL